MLAEGTPSGTEAAEHPSLPSSRPQAPQGIRPRPSPLAPRPVPRPLAVAACALLLLGGALALSADLRSAVADRLGLRDLPGVRIELVDDEPPSTPSPSASSLAPGPSSLAPGPSPLAPSPPATPPLGPTLLLGEPVTLDAARAAVPYPLLVPATLGPPDEVYLRRLDGGPMVSLVYRARPGLPAAAETGVGALLMLLPATTDGADVAKKVILGTGPEPTGSLTEVDVGGAFGYWVTGATELTILQDPSAGWGADPARPSANVLLWSAGGVTYRLETALTLPAALALAESLSSSTPTPAATPPAATPAPPAEPMPPVPSPPP